MNEIYLNYGMEVVDRVCVQDFAEDLFKSDYFSIECLDYDVGRDKILDALIINYRGEITAKQANATSQSLNYNRKLNWVGWIVTGFKV